ncbi:chromate efflux transporter [Ancylobacter terrae]|uniref:chromate efflux transporter n=1 Tax=Ancylobacter sp. sgz301288 TaxID=3342077 RepID=UPI00385C5928
MSDSAIPQTMSAGSAREVFAVFLRLGLTSFGGPIAHIGYFREEFVARRRWLAEPAFADLVALCQFLPGPASSQVGMGLGLMRAGLPGMAAAWIGFTLPSALLMLAIAYGATSLGGMAGAGWLGGLKAAAVAIVAQAVLGMAQSLCPDRPRQTLALLAAAGAVLLPGAGGQVGVILGGGLAGLVWLTAPPRAEAGHIAVTIGRRGAVMALILFAVLLVALPLAAQASGDGALRLVDAMYRAGALVFGGGHVVLPLIEAELVGPTGLSRELFLAGYGAVQAMPGPLFSFTAYVGALMPAPPNGAAGAALALVAAFLPSALLIYGALPFWAGLSHDARARNALSGINAAVVGLLGAALWDPVATAGITSAPGFAIALICYLAIALWRIPVWAVVLGAAGLGAALL